MNIKTLGHLVLWLLVSLFHVVAWPFWKLWQWMTRRRKKTQD